MLFGSLPLIVLLCLDFKEAFLKQPNVCTPSRSPALGLGLVSQPLPPPYMTSQKRLLAASPLMVPASEIALSRSSSSCASWSSGSGRSVPGTPLSFPGFSNSAVWGPYAAHTPQWPSSRDIATSFGLEYKSQAGSPCDNTLGLLHTQQNFRDIPLSSAYPGPPPGLLSPHRFVAPLRVERPSLGPRLSKLSLEAVKDVEKVNLSGRDYGVVARPVIRQPPEIVHAGMSFKVTRTVGIGASARVFGAEHAGKRYAVKVIHKAAAAASGFMRGEYLRELEVFRRIGGAPKTHQFLSTLKMSWEDVPQDRILFVMVSYENPSTSLCGF